MKYKTIFVDAPMVKSKSTWGMSIDEPNGDQFARYVDAAIEEKELEGYELSHTVPVNSSKILAASYPYSQTTGVLLIFKKKEL